MKVGLEVGTVGSKGGPTVLSESYLKDTAEKRTYRLPFPNILSQEWPFLYCLLSVPAIIEMLSPVY